MRRYTCFLVVVALSAQPASAADLRHRLGTSETLADVAKHYYGAAWKSVYIQARNDIADPRQLAVGAKIYVPGSWTYKVRRGDSPTTIAKKYLGGADRYTALMQANGIKNAANLDVGQDLIMPFHLRHVVESGDTLASISRRYYRTTRYATMIKEYNGSTQLTAGERLTVPIFDRATIGVQSRRYTAAAAPNRTATNPGSAPTPRVSPTAIEERPSIATHEVGAAPSSPSLVDSAENAETPAAVSVELRNAVIGYRQGEFVSACGALETLLEDGQVAAPDRTTLVSHLGFCAIAFGDIAAARDYFRTWIELDPKATLNPITTSPKILNVFSSVAEEAKNPQGASP